MSRSRVIIEFPDRPAYTVRIGGGLGSQLGSDLRASGVQGQRCLVVCDSDSAERCMPTLKESLQEAGFRVSDITVPAIDPGQTWECIAELHRAFAEMDLPAQTPVVVAACVQAAELMAFAVATYGGSLALVLAPASLAAAVRTVAVDRIELDAGYPVPVVAPAAPAFAVVEPKLLACSSAEEAAMGLDELSLASAYADSDCRLWLEEAHDDLAAYDEDALVLALTQVIASRADAIGEGIASR